MLPGASIASGVVIMLEITHVFEEYDADVDAEGTRGGTHYKSAWYTSHCRTSCCRNIVPSGHEGSILHVLTSAAWTMCDMLIRAPPLLSLVRLFSNTCLSDTRLIPTRDINNEGCENTQKIAHT